MRPQGLKGAALLRAGNGGAGGAGGSAAAAANAVIGAQATAQRAAKATVQGAPAAPAASGANRRHPLRRMGGGREGGKGAAAAAEDNASAAHLGALSQHQLRSFFAHREGTRGFRAPEVLLRRHDQGPPIDIWAAGVIALCLATRRYPCFHSSTDEAALVEILQLVDGILTPLAGRPPAGRGEAAQLGPVGSAAVDRAGRLVLTIAQGGGGPRRRGVGLGRGVSAWAGLLEANEANGGKEGKEGKEGNESNKGKEGNGKDDDDSFKAQLCAILDGCLRFDEDERLTARQMLELVPASK